jgi:hypothetical protein
VSSPAAARARSASLLARDPERVRILTLGSKLERVVAQGRRAPSLALDRRGRGAWPRPCTRAGWFRASAASASPARKTAAAAAIGSPGVADARRSR